MNTQKENYKKLEELGLLDVINDGYIEIVNPPYLKFTMEVIRHPSPEKYRIAMTHWNNQGGDLMHDPDMECIINTSEKTLSARTYQQDYIGIYDTAEINDGNLDELDIKKATGMDDFLSIWLGNLNDQGFGKVLNSKKKLLNRIKSKFKKKIKKVNQY